MLLAEVKKNGNYILESVGILLFPFQPIRVMITLINFFIFGYLFLHATLTIAYVYVAIAIGTHFIFLFLTFKPDGFSHWLVKRYGPNQAFQYYKTLQAITFFHYGACGFVLTSVTFDPSFFILSYSWLWTIGTILMLIGFSIRLWAINTVGIDVYYCRDFFFPVSDEEFEVKGPYRYFTNPMYGVGYLMVYGTALASASPPALVIVGISQLLIYSFFFFVEKPHMYRLYSIA